MSRWIPAIESEISSGTTGSKPHVEESELGGECHACRDVLPEASLYLDNYSAANVMVVLLRYAKFLWKENGPLTRNGDNILTEVLRKELRALCNGNGTKKHVYGLALPCYLHRFGHGLRKRYARR